MTTFQLDDTVRYVGWLPDGVEPFTGTIVTISGVSAQVQTPERTRWVDMRNLEKVADELDI